MYVGGGGGGGTAANHTQYTDPELEGGPPGTPSPWAKSSTGYSTKVHFSPNKTPSYGNPAYGPDI